MFSSITMGEVVQIVVTLAAIAGLYVRLSERLTALETKVGMMFETWKRGRL